jgi:magnesium chelatase family protein
MLEARRYLARISGPLLDRFDLFVHVQPVQTKALIDAPPSEPSETMANRVTSARQRQQYRFRRCAIHCNADMSSRQIKRYVTLSSRSKKLLEDYATKVRLSGRALHRTCKVARTLADLDHSEQVTEDHVALALTLQQARWA